MDGRHGKPWHLQGRHDLWAKSFSDTKKLREEGTQQQNTLILV